MNLSFPFPLPPATSSIKTLEKDIPQMEKKLEASEKELAVVRETEATANSGVSHMS